MSASQSQPETEPPDSPDTETSSESESHRADISLDVVFDVLRNERRRLVLAALEQEDGSTTLSELAEHIGGIENDKPPRALNAQERKRVYVGLYQCHLPKMHDAGAIEFEKNRGTVERGPMADTYHTYLERDFDPGRPWHKYYAGVAGAATVAYLASTVVFGGPVSIVFLLTVALLLVLSTVHWHERTD